MNHDEEGWIRAYIRENAFWTHDGNPRRPHALTRSGQHTGGFFLSRLVVDDNQELRRQAVEDLAEKVRHAGLNITNLDCAVGPATGATRLAESLALVIGELRGGHCRWASPEKVENFGEEPRMVFNETKIERGDRCLLIEDVLTTGGSVSRTAKAIHEAGGTTAPARFVLCLVNRSGKAFVEGYQVISLIDRHLPLWTPDACPLCAAGSEVIPAKKPPENWQRLNADYPQSAA